MRAGILILSVLPVFGALAAPAGERAMPYKAYITSTDVYVRSGPGKNYYPTGKLAEGTEVEVYRHDPGGWYAIRPPEGSFSWVSARFVEIGDDGLGTVTGDRVAARVGCEFSDIRDVIQVRLHEGEVVEILGEKQFSGTADAGKWYKIAPPAGEFRWVFGRLVDPDYMTSGIRSAPENTSPLVAPAARAAIDNNREPETLGDLEVKAAGDQLLAADQPALLPSEETLTAKPLAKVAEREGALASWVPAGSPGSNPGPQVVPSERLTSHETVEKDRQTAAAAGGPPGYVSPGIPELNQREKQQSGGSPAGRLPAIAPRLPFGEALDRLELQLSQMLAEEPTAWSFAELEIQAQALMERAQTAVERGKVRLVLNKIARSADIKNRYAQFVEKEVELDRREERLEGMRAAGVASSEHAPPLAEETATRRFDGMGRLARVVASDLGAPQYALVNDEGKVECYVTPAPGLNLRYYVGSRVGVHGALGYIPERQARLVTARHVTPLDGQLR